VSGTSRPRRDGGEELLIRNGKNRSIGIFVLALK